MRKLSLFIFSFIISLQISALDANHFTITRITAPYFIVDGNEETLVTTAYVGFEVKNTSALTYSGLIFTITSIGSSLTGESYSVISPISQQVIVGTLAPNASKACYFYVRYPANVSPIATFNVRLSDATINDKSQSFTIRNRSSISANAGGIATQSFANQDALGGIIIDTVTYTVGNVRNGDESDFQVAVSDQFDPTKMELLSTAIVQSSVPGITLGTTDSLYFVTGNGSTGATVKVVWRFRIKSFGFTNFLLPCAGATSGSTNYKYQLNSSLGSGSPVTVAASANPLVIKKYADKVNYLTCEQATFRVSVRNPGLVDVSIDSLVDQLPAGFTYVSLTVSSDVTTSNSVLSPATGTTSGLKYVGGIDQSSAVSYLVPAGDSIELIYTATAPCTTAVNLSSTVRGYVGSTEFDNDQITINVLEALPVRWLHTEVQASAQGMAKIIWKVSEDEDLDTYVVQHSTNGFSWTDIGNVKKSNSSTYIRAYEFLHYNTVRGVNLYRIVASDLQQRKHISKVVSLQDREAKSNIRLLRNPAYNQDIRFVSNAAGLATLINASGQIIWTGSVLPGYNQISISSIQSGIYWLRVDTEQHILVVQ